MNNTLAAVGLAAIWPVRIDYGVLGVSYDLAAAGLSASPYLDLGVLDYCSLFVSSPAIGIGALAQTHVLQSANILAVSPTLAAPPFSMVLPLWAAWPSIIKNAASVTARELHHLENPGPQRIRPPPIPPPHTWPPLT